jgi:hypothetical protein
MDVAYLLAAPNCAAMVLGVSGNGHALTEHGTVTFTARQGIASDGSTGYEDTGWAPRQVFAAGCLIQSVKYFWKALFRPFTPRNAPTVSCEPMGSTSIERM